MATKPVTPAQLLQAIIAMADMRWDATAAVLEVDEGEGIALYVPAQDEGQLPISYGITITEDPDAEGMRALGLSS